MNLDAWAPLQLGQDFALHGRQTTRFALQLEEHDARCADQDKIGETRRRPAAVRVVIDEPVEQEGEFDNGRLP